MSRLVVFLTLPASTQIPEMTKWRNDGMTEWRNVGMAWVPCVLCYITWIIFSLISSVFSASLFKLMKKYIYFNYGCNKIFSTCYAHMRIHWLILAWEREGRGWAATRALQPGTVDMSKWSLLISRLFGFYNAEGLRVCSLSLCTHTHSVEADGRRCCHTYSIHHAEERGNGKHRIIYL